MGYRRMRYYFMGDMWEVMLKGGEKFVWGDGLKWG